MPTMCPTRKALQSSYTLPTSCTIEQRFKIHPQNDYSNHTQPYYYTTSHKLVTRSLLHQRTQLITTTRLVLTTPNLRNVPWCILHTHKTLRTSSNAFWRHCVSKPCAPFELPLPLLWPTKPSTHRQLIQLQQDRLHDHSPQTPFLYPTYPREERFGRGQVRVWKEACLWTTTTCPPTTYTHTPHPHIHPLPSHSHPNSSLHPSHTSVG